MNAAEFNTEIFKLCDRAIKEGVAERKMSFETAIGIMEVHQQGLIDIRKHVAIQSAAAESQTQIIKP
jgi:hypothetical protein